MPDRLPHELSYSRKTQAGELHSLGISKAGLLSAGHRSRELTSEEIDELLALLEGFDDIRLRPWFRRPWFADSTDIAIRYGRRKIHACDLDGRNSTFWRLEHFFEQLLLASPKP